MKKLTLLLLLMISTNVLAEWTRVAHNDNGSNYVDFGTIKKKGHKVKMWVLTDFKTVQIFVGDNTRYLSSLGHDEFDCEEETVRKLDIYWYSGNMKNGEIVWSLTNIKKEETSVIPESTAEINLKIVCGKK